MTSEASERRETLRRSLFVYAITPHFDGGVIDYVRHATVALQAGATAIQYRDKSDRTRRQRLEIASALARVCYKQCALFIVNDDLELALDSGADGVHVGPHDPGIRDARHVMGPEAVIGASAGTVERANAGVEAGADYLGVGAIFDARQSKRDASPPRGPEVLREIRRSLPQVPIVAIGGITVANARRCVDAGADGVAVLRGIFGADDVRSATCAFVDALSTT